MSFLEIFKLTSTSFFILLLAIILIVVDFFTKNKNYPNLNKNITIWGLFLIIVKIILFNFDRENFVKETLNFGDMVSFTNMIICMIALGATVFKKNVIRLHNQYEKARIHKTETYTFFSFTILAVIIMVNMIFLLLIGFMYLI